MGFILAATIYIASLYILIGAGYVLIYKGSRILSVAQGDILLWGLYCMYILVSSLQLPPIIAVGLCIIVVCLTAFLLYQVFMKPMLGQPVWAGIIVTLGLGIVLRGVVGLVSPPSNVFLDLGIKNAALTLPLGGVLAGFSVSTFELIVIVCAVILLAFLSLFFKYVKLGIQFRGAAENPLLASLNGVNIYFVFMVSWVVAAFLAALAGILYAANGIAQQGLWIIGLACLPAVIVGGVDSLRGLVAGCLIVALSAVLGTRYGGLFLGETLPMVILLVVLIFRPWGILGTKEELERV